MASCDNCGNSDIISRLCESCCDEQEEVIDSLTKLEKYFIVASEMDGYVSLEWFQDEAKADALVESSSGELFVIEAVSLTGVTLSDDRYSFCVACGRLVDGDCETCYEEEED